MILLYLRVLIIISTRIIFVRIRNWPRVSLFAFRFPRQRAVFVFVSPFQAICEIQFSCSYAKKARKAANNK